LSLLHIFLFDKVLLNARFITINVIKLKKLRNWWISDTNEFPLQKKHKKHKHKKHKRKKLLEESEGSQDLSFDDADSSKPSLKLKIKFGKETAGDKKCVSINYSVWEAHFLCIVIDILNMNRTSSSCVLSCSLQQLSIFIIIYHSAVLCSVS
jgi:hypothetical protein